METSNNLTVRRIGDQLTFLPEGSHASPTASPENVKAKTTIATSGRKCLESLEKFSRPMSWARMFMASLIGMGGWFSTKCNLTWRMRATKSNRLYFQLVPSMRRTEEIGFGLLPTVMANRGTWQNQANGTKRDTLLGLAQKNLLPTPTHRDYRGSHAENSKSFQDRKENARGVNLVEHLQREMDGKSFRLNPRFVEEMMGYPIGWTELSPLETPSSRKQHSKSSKPSK